MVVVDILVYVLGGGVSAYFGYPDEYQAKIYCNSFRLSLAGATGLWLTMHLIAFASFRTFHSNQHRESGIFDFNTSQHQLDIGLTKVPYSVYSVYLVV